MFSNGIGVRIDEILLYGRHREKIYSYYVLLFVGPENLWSEDPTRHLSLINFSQPRLSVMGHGSWVISCYETIGSGSGSGQAGEAGVILNSQYENTSLCLGDIMGVVRFMPPKQLSADRIEA